jgi:IclR family KDG regulon transcriptional repressor
MPSAAEKREGEASVFIQSVDRALSILESFTLDHQERGVTEISKSLSLNKSTVYGLLATLERRNYVEKNAENGKYRLGLKLLDLGTIKRESLELVIVATPFLQDLVDRFQETVHLAIYDAGEVVYVDKKESRNALMNINSYVGKRNPVYCTGVGKCLLAYQPTAEVERIIAKGFRAYTPSTITDPARFREELDLIRQGGYAFDREEFERGLVCVAAPVRNHHGQVIASVSISAPTIRIDEDRLLGLIKPMLDTALSISRNLGFKS